MGLEAFSYGKDKETVETVGFAEGNFHRVDWDNATPSGLVLDGIFVFYNNFIPSGLKML